MPFAMDPSAERDTFYGSIKTTDLVEAYMERGDDGRLCFTILDEDGHRVSMTWLRPDFLDEFIAQARAREADAA